MNFDPCRDVEAMEAGEHIVSLAVTETNIIENYWGEGKKSQKIIEIPKSIESVM